MITKFVPTVYPSAFSDGFSFEGDIALPDQMISLPYSGLISGGELVVRIDYDSAVQRVVIDLTTRKIEFEAGKGFSPVGEKALIAAALEVLRFHLIDFLVPLSV